MDETVTLDVLSWDVTSRVEDVRSYGDRVAECVETSFNSGADIVLMPEFTWLGLEPLLPPDPDGLRAVARCFWEDELPRLRARLARAGKTVVLGTAPYFRSEGGFLNRAPILCGEELLHQDKLHLTPWEKGFVSGDGICLFKTHGLTVAVMICLDIEVPEIAAQLRGYEVDLILCPSATETVLGVERINRCASGRAVELGCHVAVSHLLGKSSSTLIDENVGKLAVYHPSQAAFRAAPRWVETEVERQGDYSLRVKIDPLSLRKSRKRRAETNPALLASRSIQVYSPAR